MYICIFDKIKVIIIIEWILLYLRYVSEREIDIINILKQKKEYTYRIISINAFIFT